MAAEEQPSPSQNQGIDPAISRPHSTKKLQWLPILDVVAKLIGAGAIVAATVVANRYQSSMLATNVLVQREQADSNLRAGMFHDLIGPVVGSGDNKEGISVNREQLLVELLALNFHEHFALKPLMIDVNTRLRRLENEAERKTAQERLRFIAHQIVQRQLASLTRAQNSSPSDQETCIYKLQIDEKKQEAGEEETDPPKLCSRLERHLTVKRNFDDLISVKSPNGAYNLAFSISKPDSWESQVFNVSVRVTRNVEAKKLQKQIIESSGNKDRKEVADQDSGIVDQDFELSWFDFPFSENTLLSDGTRFAFVVDIVEPYIKRANLKLVWFPRDYFAAHERPTNYREIRSKLGINVD